MGDIKSYVDGLRVVLKEASYDNTFKRPTYSVLREMGRQRRSLIAPQTLVGQSAKNLFIGMDAMMPLKLDPTSQKKLFSTNPADTVKASEYTESGSFTHDGVKYDLAKALKSVEGSPTETIPVKELSWVLKYDTPDSNRVEKADLKAPILVAKDSKGRMATVDGLHRLTKAVKSGVESLPAREVSVSDLLKVSKIEKRDGKYVLKTKDGKKTLGTHASKEKAMAQETAINISKAKRK